MKKTISINIGGRGFMIEEEAYGKLNAYLDSIKKHYAFSDQEEEILHDIEANIAEKFSSRTGPQKEVIILADVEEIIKVMGSVKEITEEEEDSDESKKEADNVTKKRLYRDGDDMVIAGVASGLAAYFGVDPVFIRIVFVALIFANGIGIVLYILFWIVVPKAVTGTQKLEMRGKPINVSEITQAVKEKSKTIGSEGSEALERISKNPVWYQILNFPIRLIERIFSLFKRIIKAVWPFIAAAAGLVALGFAIAGLVGLSIALGFALFNIGSPYLNSDLPLKEMANDPLYWIEAFSIYLTAAIPVIFLFFLGTTLFFRRNTFRPVIVGALLSVWMLSVIAAVVIAGNMIPRYKERYREIARVETVTRNYDYKDFSKLYLGANIDAKIRKGDNYSIALIGRGSELDRVRFNIESGQLQIDKKNETDGGICVFCYDQGIKAEITVPKLESFVGTRLAEADIDGFSEDIYISAGESSKTKIRLYGQKLEASIAGVNGRLELTGSSTETDVKLIGSGKLTVEDFQADKVDIDADVFSEIVLKGKARELTADLKGDAELSAFGFETDQAEINAEGDSDAEVWAVSSLNAASADTSRITYKKMPGKLEKQVSDQGAIIQADWELIKSGEEKPVFLRIEADAEAYNPAMSSIRGIGLTPSHSNNGDISYYIWKTDNGWLVQDWDGAEKTRTLKIESPAKKVYWTFIADDNGTAAANGDPANIFLEAYGKDGRMAGGSELQLEKQGDGSFMVVGNSQ